MAWTERQHAILAEMGLRVWAPSPAAPVADEAAASAQESAASAAAALEAAVPTDALARPQAVAKPVAVAPTVAVGQPVAMARPVAGAQPVTVVPATAPAPPSACATMDWPALRAAVQACRACSLCESRTQTVFGVGNERAQWMIVGEAPGEQEDLKGEPFVGAAGQLLDAMLRAVGLTRSDDTPERQVYIANTLKCRPPRNRNPEPDEMARCEPFLVRQVELVQPRLILAMGRFAVRALLRSEEPVGRLRGRVHSYQGVPVVVTYHPAYLLRNPADKARAWDDLCLAAEVAQRG